MTTTRLALLLLLSGRAAVAFVPSSSQNSWHRTRNTLDNGRQPCAALSPGDHHHHHHAETTMLTKDPPRSQEEDDEDTSVALASTESSLEQATTSPPKKQEKPVMSQAIPFLECPKVLAECNELAGNYGFDPLGLASSREQLWHYREAEIKHARLAMLAAAGWPISELLDRQIAAWLGIPALLDAADRAPSPLNMAGLGRVPATFWGFCLGLTAATELYGMAKASQPNRDPHYIPGHLGFDPLNFYPATPEGRWRMQLAEIKHGRVAMVAVTAYLFLEYITKEGVVDEIESFFFLPFGAVEPIERFAME